MDIADLILSMCTGTPLSSWSYTPSPTRLCMALRKIVMMNPTDTTEQQEDALQPT